MATVLEQLQSRLTVVDEQLQAEYAARTEIGMFKQTGDKQDRVVMQNLEGIFARIKTLEAERINLQNQINRLSGVRRAWSAAVRRC